MKTATERDTIAPMPIATATTCTYTPAAFPTTLARPAVRPDTSERLTTKTTLGPGIAMMMNAVTQNASRWLVGSTCRA